MTGDTPGRSSGVLLPLSALPSPYGIGDLGPQASHIVDWLAGAEQTWWQFLPLNLTEPGCGNSPYSSMSAFAGNPLYLSPELLMRDGLLTEHDLPPLPAFSAGRTDYPAVHTYKQALLARLAERHPVPDRLDGYGHFCALHALWLEDFALFRALKRHFHGRPWHAWPADIARRDARAIDHYQDLLTRDIAAEKLFQFVFWQQWTRLREHAHRRGLRLFGDLPIYVTADSVEVWTRPHFFKLHADGTPAYVAGVPPDYFSATGQRWGNPVYDWAALRADGFRWWLDRLRHQFRFFDLVRLDHFRGFEAYWEIPAAATTAVHGAWTPVPGADLFGAISAALPEAALVAEDLGIITDPVRDLMAQFRLPGMKVLLFAFGDDARNPYLPHHHVPDALVCTGTHDTNTVRGWFTDDATDSKRHACAADCGRALTAANCAEALVRLTLASVARQAIIPMQDLLGLDSRARFNRPGTAAGNWEWRLLPDTLTPARQRQLAALTRTYGRCRS